jgi:hypothetical protein
MWKLKSAGEIPEFLSKNGRAVWLVGLMLLGLVFIFIGNNPSSDSPVMAQSEEARVSEMCAMMEGVGECRVMMTYQPESDEVYAVLVLCEGAESVAVREKITSLFTSLYGIGAHRVEIEKLNKN